MPRKQPPTSIRSDSESAQDAGAEYLLDLIARQLARQWLREKGEAERETSRKEKLAVNTIPGLNGNDR